MESEYLFQAFLAIQRLKDTLSGLNVPDFPVKIIFRLLDQSLRRISIPFEGEPLTGLQIMGLLETRTLDFQNLVLFSANEGFLPRIAAGHSFVPYHLRKGFGMPTYEDRDAMYAYYFYRLIQRTENTVIVYNSITEGISSSEKSRFLYQLLYDSEFEIEELNLSFNFKGTSNEPIRVEASEAHIQKMISRYSEKNLSPSAINTYLECKLKFYFKYIAGIKETSGRCERTISKNRYFRSFSGRCKGSRKTWCVLHDSRTYLCYRLQERPGTERAWILKRCLQYCECSGICDWWNQV